MAYTLQTNVEGQLVLTMDSDQKSIIEGHDALSKKVKFIKMKKVEIQGEIARLKKRASENGADLKEFEDELLTRG